MAELSPLVLAVVWSAAMVLTCTAAAMVVVRSVPPQPGPRLFAFLGVESLALVFLAVAILASFVWPEPFGLTTGDTGPFVVVAVAFALLVLGLLWGIFLAPVLRRTAASKETGVSRQTIERP